MSGRSGKGRLRKQPAVRETPQATKAPRLAFDPTSSDALPPVWNVRIMDIDGPWGWSKATKDDLIRQIQPKLGEFETMNWAEIGQNGSHPIPVYQIVKDARKRLREINQADLDDLFSLRLTGQRRIWGIRDWNILKILWWDPRHEIKLSRKRHT